MFNAKPESGNDLENEGNDLENKLLAVLNHHRHSWLNDLQLIFGYIKLKKYDRLEAYVEKLQQKLESESRISTLPDPSLVLGLLQFGYNNQTFKLNVEIESGTKQLLKRTHFPQLNEKLLHMLTIFQHIAQYESELTLQLNNEGDVVVLIFDYTGQYDRAKWTEIRDGDHPDKWLHDVTWTAEEQRLKAVITILN